MSLRFFLSSDRLSADIQVPASNIVLKMASFVTFYEYRWLLTTSSPAIASFDICTTRHGMISVSEFGIRHEKFLIRLLVIWTESYLEAVLGNTSLWVVFQTRYDMCPRSRQWRLGGKIEERATPPDNRKIFGGRERSETNEEDRDDDRRKNEWCSSFPAKSYYSRLS